MNFDIIHTQAGFHAAVVNADKKRSEQAQYLGFFREIEASHAANVKQYPVRHWVRGELKTWK